MSNRNFRTVIPVVLLFAALTVANLAKPAEGYSVSERRALAQRPTLTWQALRSGSFMRDFAAAAADQFPLRQSLRRLRAGFSRTIVRQKDCRGYYLAAGHLSRLEYPLQSGRWDAAVAGVADIYGTFLADTGCRVYFSMIPDKNCFLAPAEGYPALDYDALEAALERDLPFAVHIGLRDTLALDSFYRTDPHWRQETLIPTARRLAQAMGTEIADAYTVQDAEAPFFGAWYAQAALPAAPDALRYLTCDVLEGCTVTSYDTGLPRSVPLYDLEKAAGRDPYALFLGGADALLTVTNPAGNTDRELVVFRDSFGSAIAPLLATGYRRVTLVDLRYLRTAELTKYVRFGGQDVLFLYSTTLLNSGLTLR